MPEAKQYEVNRCVTSTTIASGTETDEVDLHGTTLVGLIVPSGLVSTAITFKMSDTKGGTYVQMNDTANAALSPLTVDTNQRYISLDPTLFCGVRFIKVVMGSSETNKELKLISRPV